MGSVSVGTPVRQDTTRLFRPGKRQAPPIGGLPCGMRAQRQLFRMPTMQSSKREYLMTLNKPYTQSLTPLNQPAVKPTMGYGKGVARRAHCGWTLVECCSALAVVSVLASSGVSSFSDLINRKKLEVKSGQLLADLHYLRSEVVSRNEGLRISFGQDDGGSCYVLHSGSADQCQCSSSGQASCQDPNSRVLKSVAMPIENSITITPNVASIHFDPRLGTSSPAGTVRMMDTQGRSIHHVVSIRGRVRTCSAGVPLPNLPEC